LDVLIQPNILNITGKGGKTPYQFAIDNTTSFTPQSSFYKLAIGKHTVYIKDANGCMASNDITIDNDVVKAAIRSAYPAQNATSVPVNGITFQWVAANYAANQVYDIYLKKGNDNYSLIASDISTASYTYNTTLENSSNYTWKVALKSATNAIDYAEFTFTTASGVATTPTAPILTLPVNGGTVDLSTTLKWTPQAGDFKYDLYFDSNNATTLVVLNLTNTEYTINNLANGKTYYWKVKIKSSITGASATSMIWSFTAQKGDISTVLIPSGTFIMGSPLTEVDRNPNETQHQVTLSAFRMSKYEITNAQYAAFLNAKKINSDGQYKTGSYPEQVLVYASSGNYDWGLHYNGGQWIPVNGYENNPIINVTWYGATEFAAYVGGALPTEAQWEYACRAVTTTPFSTGVCLTNEQANYVWSSSYSSCSNTVTTYPGKTQPVGTYAPNAYGLYDMHGNVCEWCADWYGTYPTSPQTDIAGVSTGTSHVLRGGGWFDDYQICRSAFRGWAGPSDKATGFGFRVAFPTTENSQTVTDIDGNIYHTVKIGTQTWMVENLKTTHYNDGISIPNVTDNNVWASLSEGAYCWYNNDISFKNTYGALYNWYTVSTGKLAPTGWHVATDNEWDILVNFLGGEKVAGANLKEVGTSHWSNPNTGATNETGFTAVPSGIRVDAFYGWPLYTRIWTSTDAWYREIGYETINIVRSRESVSIGKPVRCIKDDASTFVIQTVDIPAGTFIMGSPESEVGRYANETQHQVTLSAFKMSKYEITNAQYAAFLNAKNIGSNGLYTTGTYPTNTLIYSNSSLGLTYNGSQWIPVAGYENAPVIYVTWYGAAEYATYIGGTLPTEAQWEYACRAGTTTPFNTGNFLTNLQANYYWAYPYNGGINTVTTFPGKTQTVGNYAANTYGLYDMHGNVSEWCADWYGTYSTTAQINPTGAATDSSGGRVIRGGSWYGNALLCRSAERQGYEPSTHYSYYGFRVVFVP